MKTLNAIRDYLKNKNWDAVIIPTADPHQNEVPADRYQIRRALSGFTGSAGTLVVMDTQAGLWTDGRYELQGAQELEGTGIDLYITNLPGTKKMLDALKELPEDATIAVDAGRMSFGEYKTIEKGIAPRTLTGDLDSDALWGEFPPIPGGELIVLDDENAGASVQEKIDRLRKTLEEKKVDGSMIGASEDIAWLLNARGSDVANTPVFYAYLWVDQSASMLFVDTKKVGDGLSAVLEKANISVHPYETVYTFAEKIKDQKVLLDENRSNARMVQIFRENNDVLLERNPSEFFKARKNEAEIRHMKLAHHADGLALTNFFYWLEKEGAGHTEYEIGTKLLQFRQEQKGFIEESFGTIAGYKENGAIVHYHAHQETAKTLEKESLLLLDSGGQYDVGTTDITRTVAMGTLREEEKKDYTYTLKAHIALSTAQFLEGTKGIVLDGFCRYPLWKEGIDFKHGTGHGVGYRLSVHEGPMSISPVYRAEAIETGQILSIEPGIYRAGKHGVRIENLAVVEERVENEFGRFLGFSPITICYIDTDPVDAQWLTQEEIQWLNEYNAFVYESLADELTEEVRAFLHRKTRPIA